MSVREGKLLYHVTALDNLENIFTYGLLSRTDVFAKGIILKDVADPKIIEKRTELGILQYVPFHFFEKTPFTHTVYARHPDTTFCVIAIYRAFAHMNNFKICTAHPLSENPKAEILDYNEGIERISWESIDVDWDKIKQGLARLTDKDDNARMAECLATSPVMPQDFQSIYVPTEAIKSYVEQLAQRKWNSCPFYVNVNKKITQEGKNDYL